MAFIEAFEVTATDVVLLVLFLYVVYKLFFKRREEIELPPKQVLPPPLKKQDMTIDQLRRYNGVDDERICMAICGKVYDVTRGKDFYGPEGPYGAMAGHDATRALANMDIKLVKDEYDDHSGMDASEMEDAREWEERMALKYAYVGRLLAPGEEPANYEEEKTNED